MTCVSIINTVKLGLIFLKISLKGKIGSNLISDLS